MSQQTVSLRIFAFFMFMIFAYSNLDCSSLIAQDPTAKEKQAVRQIKSKIDRAGKLYTSKKLSASAEYIDNALVQIMELTKAPRPELLELIKPEYDRLAKAHQLLTQAGEKLAELTPLPTAVDGNLQAVSFTKSVAPILVAKCGNCHVNRNRGNFSSATFDALDKSAMLAYGMTDGSRLIEVIENGEMPKGGLTIEPAELQTLKDWMIQGAKFDGNNPQQSLNEFVSANALEAAAPAMEISKPTGKETVSFGLHIAPILVENCAQCHMVGNNPRGNFSQATFRELLAGGDSGPPIVPGKSKNSMLFRRIESGEMPPDGKLDNKLIQLIGTWIDEGAKFDGMDPRLNTRSVAAVAKANAQSHEELMADRQNQSTKTWTLVMSNIAGATFESKNFLVTGSTKEERLEPISQLLETLVPEITSALDSDSSAPLVKGRASVFVFDKRYDFSEFGKMVEQRDFPKQVSGFWNYTITDAYVTILLTRNQTADEAKVSLAQQIASIHTASLAPDVPRWFSNGVGYWVTKKILSREDEVKRWEADAKAAAASMKQPDDFVSDRMPSDRAGLVSYLFVKNLKSNGSGFNQLMESMRDGNTFETSFVKSYGTTPDEMLKKQYQKGW